MSYIKRIPLKRLIKLIEVSVVEMEKDKLYQMYLADKPWLKEDPGFNKYYESALNKAKPKKIETRSMDVLMQELKGEDYGAV